MSQRMAWRLPISARTAAQIAAVAKKTTNISTLYVA